MLMLYFNKTQNYIFNKINTVIMRFKYSFILSSLTILSFFPNYYLNTILRLLVFMILQYRRLHFQLFSKHNKTYSVKDLS